MIKAIREASPDDMLARAGHLVDPLSRVNDWSKKYHHSETAALGSVDVDVIELKSYVADALEIVWC
jgi:hypothetical protein